MYCGNISMWCGGGGGGGEVGGHFRGLIEATLRSLLKVSEEILATIVAMTKLCI